MGVDGYVVLKGRLRYKQRIMGKSIGLYRDGYRYFDGI